MICIRLICFNSFLSLPFVLLFMLETLFEFSREASKDDNNLTVIIKKSTVLKISPTGKFCVIWNAFDRSERVVSSDSITFVTHGSLDHAYHLSLLARYWNGPISASIYLPTAEPDQRSNQFKYLSYISFCEKEVRERVKLHIFYRTSWNDCKNFSIGVPTSCKIQPRPVPRVQSVKPSETLPYPINLARNIARAESATKFHLMADIELIPSINFAAKFLRMFWSLSTDLKNAERQVFVVPTFEVLDRIPLPHTKSQLRAYLKSKKAVPFHQHRAYECHRIPMIDRWIDESSEDMHIFLSTKWLRPCWEPVYIAQNNVPKFDERFTGYGKNKIQQAYELCRADFDFHILSSGFLIHRNISRMSSRFWSRVRRSVDFNNILFGRFSSEMNHKYPDSRIRKYCDAKRFEINGKAFLRP